MQYNNINNLSMTGGDDFTDISQILDRCVLLDVNQTILSNKIFDGITNTQFDGDVELNAMTTHTGTLTNTGTIDTTGTLNVGGTLNLTTDIVADKPTLTFSNTGDTVMSATNIDVNATTVDLQSGGVAKIQVGASTTTLNNTTTSVQSGGVDKIVVIADNTAITNTDIATTGILTHTGNATLKGTTITLQDATPTTHFTQTSTRTDITNSTINFDSGGSVADKYRQSSTLTIVDNDEIRLRYRVSNRFVQTGTATNLTNTTITLQDETPATRFTQNNGTTSIINNTINLADNTPTTRFSQTNGTTTITNTDIATNGILTQTGSATLKGTTITLQDATPTTRFLQNNGTTTITNTDIATNGILTQTGNFTAKGTTITLQDATPTTRYLQTSTATTLTNATLTLADGAKNNYQHTTTTTTIRNATINLNDNTPTTRFTQTSVSTTIKNTQINLQNNAGTNMITVGASEVNINTAVGCPKYYTGTSGATTNPLVSFALTLYPQLYNTTGSQLLLGYPDANTTKINRTIRFPYAVRLVGWQVSGDATAHGADTLRLRITTGTSGGGTSYYSLICNVPANGLLSSSCSVNDVGDYSGFTSIGFINSTVIPMGTQVLFWENTGSVFNNEMMFVLFFAQEG